MTVELGPGVAGIRCGAVDKSGTKLSTANVQNSPVGARVLRTLSLISVACAPMGFIDHVNYAVCPMTVPSGEID